MDGKQFDAFARRLTDRLSRRHIVASMLGLAGAALVVDPTDANVCRLAAQKCVRSSQCCSGLCDTARSSRRSQRNRCICQPNESVCRGLCFDFATDEQNCGGCDVRCRPNQSCIAGECICDDPNAIVCGDVCTDITTADHCGPTCQPCKSGYTCEDGACTCGGNDCTDTQACCGGSCIEVVQNDNNCGACDNVCAAGELCIASKCWAKCTVTQSCPLCVNLINGEPVYINSFNFGYNPPCSSQDDCAAGDLCFAYYQNSTGADWDRRPGICMTAGICV